MRRCVAYLAVLALLAGCGTSLSDSLTDTTWRTGGGQLIAFHSDGNYSVGFSVPEDVTDAETEWGIWSLEGDSLTMTPDAGSPNCAEIPGTYTVAIVDGGDLTATLVGDDCDVRSSDFPYGLTPQPDAES